MSDTQLQLVTFEQAKRLKAAGFGWECDYRYFKDGRIDWLPTGNHNKNNATFSAPTVALALKWFRDVKGISCGVAYGVAGKYFGAYLTNEYPNHLPGIEQDTYELAESALLDALLDALEKEERDSE